MYRELRKIALHLGSEFQRKVFFYIFSEINDIKETEIDTLCFPLTYFDSFSPY